MKTRTKEIAACTQESREIASTLQMNTSFVGEKSKSFPSPSAHSRSLTDTKMPTPISKKHARSPSTSSLFDHPRKKRRTGNGRQDAVQAKLEVRLAIEPVVHVFEYATLEIEYFL